MFWLNVTASRSKLSVLGQAGYGRCAVKAVPEMSHLGLPVCLGAVHDRSALAAAGCPYTKEIMRICRRRNVSLGAFCACPKSIEEPHLRWKLWRE